MTDRRARIHVSDLVHAGEVSAGAVRRAVAVVLVTLLPAAGAAARGLPLTVELDGCVAPTTACSTRDVVELNAGKRKLSFAVETLRVVSTSHATSGGVLAEMKLRPLRLHGPDELLHRLEPGAHVRMRGALRLRDRYLIVQAVDAR